jgi:hypothetical protein
MWEVGYAMALGKPTIIITQEIGELPFDIRDMETIKYDRNHLSETLGQPLKRVTIDTIASLLSSGKAEGNSGSVIHNELVGELLEQIRELRSIVNQAVRTWNPAPEQAHSSLDAHDNLRSFEGAWVNRESGTHFYSRVINDELVTPYCYGGNDLLTSVLYGWKKVGEFWFARFCWLTREISGFAFLKQESLDLLTGAWWSDLESKEIPENPNFRSGVSERWERDRQAEIPDWASRFFEEVHREGLVNHLISRYREA